LLELTDICKELTNNTIEITPVIETRQADIRIYITDNTEVTKLTGWSPKIGVKQIMTEIYHWIHENESKLKPILS
jgi:CDP-paratose 2-epimerase